MSEEEKKGVVLEETLTFKEGQIVFIGPSYYGGFWCKPQDVKTVDWVNKKHLKELIECEGCGQKFLFYEELNKIKEYLCKECYERQLVYEDQDDE